MDTTNERSDVFVALESVICRDPDIEFAIVFGSQVTDDARPSSDLDIAVKFAEKLSSHDRFQKRCFLSGELQQEDIPFIDLSDIDELPLAVAHDAVHGRVRCGDEQTFRAVKAEIEAAFTQQSDDIRRRQRAVIDRIAEEGLRG
jgi:predicted nucleotidyltransferase